MSYYPDIWRWAQGKVFVAGTPRVKLPHFSVVNKFLWVKCFSLFFQTGLNQVRLAKTVRTNIQFFHFSTKIQGTNLFMWWYLRLRSNLNLFWVYSKWIFKSLPIIKSYFLLVCVHLSNSDQKLVAYYQQSFQLVLKSLFYEGCFLGFLPGF